MRFLAINYYSLKKKRWYYFFNMTFSYILTQSSSSKGDQYGKKMATYGCYSLKKENIITIESFQVQVHGIYLKKKTPRGLIEETKHPIKPVFSHHFNSFRAVFSSSSDSFFIHSRALWEQWFFESLCTYCFMSDDKITPSCNYFLCLREIY